MDLENLGPIALFIVYMAISAWSKQKKARQRTRQTEKPKVKPPSPLTKPLQEVGGILAQLKKELFEIDEAPLVLQQTMPEYDEPEEEIEIPVSEPVTDPSFVEGSQAHNHDHPLTTVETVTASADSGQSLEEILAPYSKVEQGIILHEILGKPRSRQKNDEWFHKS